MRVRYSSIKKSNTLIYFSLIIVLGLWSCTSPTDSDKDDTLYVKFINESNSSYTITNIQLQAMGKSGEETSSPGGDWSENILKDGKTIAPGGHVFFTLKIPNLHWSQYRLGVSDDNGGEVMLHEQDGYISDWQPSITHWGSDERTVGVQVTYSQSEGYIYINGYSDWAGID